MGCAGWFWAWPTGEVPACGWQTCAPRWWQQRQAIFPLVAQGQMLAGLLGWPQATFASAVTITEQRDPRGPPTRGEVAREVDAGMMHVAVPFPAVITADLRLNNPRYGHTRLPDVLRTAT